VTALAELLELMHGAHRSLGSVQGTLREWRDESLVRRLESDYWSIDVDETQHRSYEGEFEQLTEFKLALPDRVRVETRVPGGRPDSIVVCDGSRRSTWFRGSGADVEDEDLRNVSWVLGATGRLLDPFWLLGFLELGTPQKEALDGRELLFARGRPRYPLPWPFGPADEHELTVDPERGTLIRMAGTWRGRDAFVHELIELEHDVTFDDKSFALVTPGGATGLGLREVVSLAGFQVWALPRPVLDVTYRAEPVESVTLTYDDAILVLTPASISHARLSIGEVAQVERGDRSYLLSPGVVTFVEDETSISLGHATATGDDLIDIAETLVPLN
jgi:hypothetical protein